MPYPEVVEPKSNPIIALIPEDFVLVFEFSLK